jgi:PAS domain S-box-containing protein
MKIKFFEQKTLFQSLFQTILLILLVPLIISGVYLFLYSKNIFFIFLITLSVITICLALGSAYIISSKLQKPLIQFTKSATEIARGNFSHKVEIQSDDEIGRLARIFNYMTTELRRLNEMNLNRIITEKNKTETIIKNIADGVIVTDPENKIVLINSLAERLFGLNEKEVINNQLKAVIQNTELIKLINDVSQFTDQQNSLVEIKIKPKKARKESILQAKGARVVGTDGKLIGIATIFRDITKEKEIDQMKTELVSMVAHELRSPLTSIAGFSELLLDTNITPDQSKEYADIILKESNRLGDLINKFLDISRIESGKSQINKIPLHIGYLIENILEMNIYLAEKKGIKVNIDIPDDLPTVNVDKEMMEELMLNLFTNAVKYSPDNTNIKISVRNEEDLVVSVQDEGYGIPQEALPKIFNKFYRVTTSEHTKDIEGTGLGLSLAKEIVEIHGGTIGVDSKLGKGSTFYFSLPKLNGIDKDSYNNEFK